MSEDAHLSGFNTETPVRLRVSAVPQWAAWMDVPTAPYRPIEWVAPLSPISTLFRVHWLGLN